jgi:hypothetical protein
MVVLVCGQQYRARNSFWQFDAERGGNTIENEAAEK